MEIDHIDHVVLTVRDIDRTIAFYRDVLGMRSMSFGDGRRALSFGNQKINLHEVGHEFEPKAAQPAPGSADFCLICDTPINALIDELERRGVRIEEGPESKCGALGKITSVYVRDPDRNLVEISAYAADD